MPTIQAMEEVGGPVVAIALILAAVFIPTAAIPGITGRLYQQFAITIAISVLISAFNALTLSPALAALLLKPKDHDAPAADRWRASSRASTAVFPDHRRELCLHLRRAGAQVRRSPCSALSAMAVLAVFMGERVPAGFIPQEDQGYLFVALQLAGCGLAAAHRCRGAAGHERPAEDSRHRRRDAVDGFSLLTQTQSTNTAFFFVSLKPWEERKSRAEQIEAIQANVQQQAGGVSDGLAFSFPPPAIPGIGTSGGVTMILQDRSGNDDPNFLTKNLCAYLGALSKRPEIAAAIPSYLPAVPQLYADVDREKACSSRWI